MARMLNKWNWQKHEYEPYEIPDDWDVVFYTTDMDQVTTCPHCGQKITFGRAYTSLEIHTASGFGYPVCGRCHEVEWNRRME